MFCEEAFGILDSFKLSEGCLISDRFPVYMKYFILAITLVLLPACSSVDDNDGDTGSSGINVSKNTSATTPSFGDAYSITTDAEGVQPPALDDGVLTMWVSFSGGCQEHDFVLGQNNGAEKIELWFTHNANSDFCEAYLTEKIVLDISQDIVNGISVELLNPNGDPFVLR